MARVARFEPPTDDAIPLDAIVPVLNPVRQMDLDTILRLTPAPQRVPVALAFAGMDIKGWAAAAGFQGPTVYRWVHLEAEQARRIPLGAGFRLARVLGAIDVELLFEAYL